MVWARMTGPALRVTAIITGVTEVRSREARGRPVSLVQNKILNNQCHLHTYYSFKPNQEMMLSPI